MLSIRTITKTYEYETKQVLDRLDLDIEEGSIFGLIGVNGAGKSTLLRCICGVLEPEEGTVELDGIDLLKNPGARKEVLYISDDPYFAHGATIRSMKMNYQAFYRFHEDSYQKYLAMFGLDENKQISSFSKGMKRQTSLLFALAVQPKLLMLDEAFDGLDPLVRMHFKQALVELIEDTGITVIISSHNLKELDDICDSYGILENGKIETYGDLLNDKQNINKYQLAFLMERTAEDFAKFNPMHINIEGRVVNLVIKGDREEVTEQLNQMHPLLLDELPVNFEELFIYEMESRGYRS